MSLETSTFPQIRHGWSYYEASYGYEFSVAFYDES